LTLGEEVSRSEDIADAQEIVQESYTAKKYSSRAAAGTAKVESKARRAEN